MTVVLAVLLELWCGQRCESGNHKFQLLGLEFGLLGNLGTGTAESDAMDLMAFMAFIAGTVARMTQLEPKAVEKTSINNPFQATTIKIQCEITSVSAPTPESKKT